jgi:hypothetical protein
MKQVWRDALYITGMATFSVGFFNEVLPKGHARILEDRRRLGIQVKGAKKTVHAIRKCEL